MILAKLSMSNNMSLNVASNNLLQGSYDDFMTLSELKKNWEKSSEVFTVATILQFLTDEKLYKVLNFSCQKHLLYHPKQTIKTRKYLTMQSVMNFRLALVTQIRVENVEKSSLVIPALNVMRLIHMRLKYSQR